MKKLILGLATVALAAGMSFAGDISVGGRAAVNLSTFWGDDIDDPPWSFGFNAGVDGKIGINDMISVVPEVGVDMRRVSEDDEYTWTTWAIDIPVLARFAVAPQFFLEVGPSFDFILSSTMEFDNEAVSLTGEKEIDFGDGDAINTFEFGIVAGAGYSVMPNLDINIRFAMGITSIVDSKMNVAGLELGWDDVENMQIQLGATFWFL